MNKSLSERLRASPTSEIMVEAAVCIDAQAVELERLLKSCRVAVMALAHACQEHGKVYEPAYETVSNTLQEVRHDR